MLAEAATNPLPKSDLPTKAIKRRRLDDGSSRVTDSEHVGTKAPDPSVDGLEGGNGSESITPTMHKQTVFDEFSVSDDGSEDDFEDVDLEADAESDQRQIGDGEPLHLDLSRKPGPDIAPSARRRKLVTAAERKIRLDVHKWHVLCLLGHLQRRNHWCDDEQVQSILKPLIPRNIIRLLHLDASKPQFERTHSFNTAIDEISKIWRSEWKITEPGMRRAYWREDPDDFKDVDGHPDPVDKDDFRDAAKSRAGSRDLGAQLFCSLLRAVAVDTRLVASLQPLPFSGVAKGTTPEKPKAQHISASSPGREPPRDRNGNGTTTDNPRWRLYDAEPEQSTPKSRAMKKPRVIKDSPYPIFWVEVFNEALQKWVPVDPVVRSTINKPKTGFEPPANDSLNSLSYVISFEDDGSAKDVTRRYAQFYNGKTRRSRVESTKGGEKWWRETMFFFEKPFPDDRDVIEDAELLAREESEQMPKNVQDFKKHPLYALERHLRRNEAIHPRREIGKVTVGLSKDGRLESVFRRRDVVVVRTADQWYRLGRDVRIGQQPLKRVTSQKRRERATGEDSEQEEGALLYAEFQTDLYIPPEVVNDKVPKNAYGNLDVFVPSMIPAGGIHVQHPDAAKAARLLGIDYADAVTGFEFKGRQGTAVTNGIVVAATYREALVQILDGLADERARSNNEKRSSVALQMWKRFLIALRIRGRVRAKYGEGGSPAAVDENEEDDPEDEIYRDEDRVDEGGEGGGGFFPEETDDPLSPLQALGSETLNDQSFFELVSTDDVHVPIVIHESSHKLPHAQQDTTPAIKQPQLASVAVGGGSLPTHDSPTDEGGGFIIEDLPIPGLDAQPSASTANLQTSSSAAQQAMGLPTGNTTSVKPQNHGVTETSHHDMPTTKQGDLITPSSKSSKDQARHLPRSPSPTTISPVPPSPERQAISTADNQKDEDGERDSDDVLERGSLLSHDPEDEDAEPEWLAEAMDSD